MYSDDEEPRMDIMSPEHSKTSFPASSSESIMQVVTESLTPENSDATLNTLDLSSKEEPTQELPVPASEMCYLPFVMPYKIMPNKKNAPPPPKNMRLKKKITKAKERGHYEDTQDTALNKKKQQMIRNRIAAQESRNRKNKETEDLISENARLKAENEILKQQLLHKQTQINCIYEVIDKLSSEARAEFENKRKGFLNQESRVRPFPVFKLPVFMSAILFGIICIACVYGIVNANNSPQTTLPEESVKSFKPKQIDDGRSNVPQPVQECHKELNINETQISLSSFQEMDITAKSIICNECKALDILR